jgi:uncharacterized protein YdaU (DUF1376 family)
MNRPWFPFWPRDYLADTQHLTTAEHGAYCLLILHYWTTGGLVDDDDELARITRQPLKSWRRMRPTIARFFHDGWRHKRIDQDIAKLGQVVAKRQAAGSIGGTRASINRQRGQQLLDRDGSKSYSKPRSKTAANEQQELQQKSSDATATKEELLTPVSGAARARGDEIPNKSTAEIAEPPAGFAEKAREAVQKSSGIASGALVSTMQAKGWVK